MSIEPFIRCSQIQKSLTFYTGLLDFKIRQAPDPEPGSFMSMYALLEREGHFLHVSQHAGDGVFGNVIFIRVKNIDFLYQQFIENGLKVDDAGENAVISMQPVQQTWGMKEFSVRDPDGNRITFGHSIN